MHILGYCLLSLPFIAIGVAIYIQSGWEAVFLTFGITIIIMIPIVAGAILVTTK
jgi:hypothetical protein